MGLLKEGPTRGNLNQIFCERSEPKDLCVATIAFPLLVAGSFAMEENKE